MAASKRLTKELAELTTNPPPNMTISLIDDDIHKWKVLIQGPAGTPYAGGNFNLHITLPNDYPFKPPVLNFATKIYHPNVSNDDKGSMCLGLLRPDTWKPSSKLGEVLRFVLVIIETPDPDDAVEQSIAHEFKEDHAKWEKEAREWTKKYAKA